jgi:hypothetical protein
MKEAGGAQKNKQQRRRKKEQEDRTQRTQVNATPNAA